MHREWYIIVWLCGELQCTWLPLFNITHVKGFCCVPGCCTLGCTLFYYSCRLILWKCSRWPVETRAGDSRGSEVLVLDANASFIQSCGRKYIPLFLTQRCNNLLEICMFILQYSGFYFESFPFFICWPGASCLVSRSCVVSLCSAQMKIDVSNVQRQHMRLIIFN